MLPVMGAIFLKLKFFLNIAPVFAGRIIAPFAVRALQSNQLNYILFARHNKPH